jgi:hypothetical protein
MWKRELEKSCEKTDRVAYQNSVALEIGPESPLIFREFLDALYKTHGVT